MEEKIHEHLNGGVANLTQEEKETLLKIARETLKSYLQDRRLPDFAIDSATLKEKRGAFVTLNTKQGDLRGCIGFIEGFKPLWETVREMALSAALNDPRFPPVSLKELEELTIEISVLSPLKKITDISEIVVGKHGIVLRRGFYSGLLLPQVATDYGWTREEFLEHTCLKAGLPPNAWADQQTQISIFSADVFGEK